MKRERQPVLAGAGSAREREPGPLGRLVEAALPSTACAVGGLHAAERITSSAALSRISVTGSRHRDRDGLVAREGGGLEIRLEPDVVARGHHGGRESIVHAGGKDYHQPLSPGHPDLWPERGESAVSAPSRAGPAPPRSPRRRARSRPARVEHRGARVAPPAAGARRGRGPWASPSRSAAGARPPARGSPPAGCRCCRGRPAPSRPGSPAPTRRTRGGGGRAHRGTSGSGRQPPTRTPRLEAGAGPAPRRCRSPSPGARRDGRSTKHSGKVWRTCRRPECASEPARGLERDLERRRRGRLDGEPRPPPSARRARPSSSTSTAVGAASHRRAAGRAGLPRRARISMVVTRGAAPATSPQK